MVSFSVFTFQISKFVLTSNLYLDQLVHGQFVQLAQMGYPVNPNEVNSSAGLGELVKNPYFTQKIVEMNIFCIIYYLLH